MLLMEMVLIVGLLCWALLYRADLAGIIGDSGNLSGVKTEPMDLGRIGTGGSGAGRRAEPEVRDAMVRVTNKTSRTTGNPKTPGVAS
jgi:hypothetical protein